MLTSCDDGRWAAPRAVMARSHLWYETRPLATAGVLFTVLAGVRVLGAFNTVAMVASVALTPITLCVVPYARWPEHGIRPVRGWRPMALSLGLVLVSYVVAAVACQLVFGSGPNNWVSLLPDLVAMAPGSHLAAVLLMVVCMGVLVPVAEEVFYRGLLHQAVGSRLGINATVVTTSLGWACVHVGDYGLHPFNGAVLAGMVPSVFLMGLALGACRVLTGSVWACAAAQGVANLVLVGWAVRL